MINFRKAFTLAEVLLAMAIVGVVASLTIPQVVNSTQKDQSGAVLGRAVEQIELGCQNMIQTSNDNVMDGSYSDTLSTISPAFSAAALAPYIGAVNKSGTLHFSKFPATVVVTPVAAADDTVNAKIANVKIDTNGAKNPNQAGFDIFSFELYNDGKLKPSDDVTRKIISDGFKLK